MLSGGSAFGLDAASGAADALVEAGRGFAVGPARVPIVPAAILFDLLNGGDKQWGSNPYKRLGREALDMASREFELGSFGAGAGATTLDLKGGLGSASAVTEGGFTVGALVAVNSVGSVTRGGGPAFWAAPFQIGEEFGGQRDAQRFEPEWEPNLGIAESSPNANTTIAIVATDAALDQSQTTRLAAAAHAGLARAIVPSHTIFDGDLVFAGSTGRRPLSDPGDRPVQARACGRLLPGTSGCKGRLRSSPRRKRCEADLARAVRVGVTVVARLRPGLRDNPAFRRHFPGSGTAPGPAVRQAGQCASIRQAPAT